MPGDLLYGSYYCYKYVLSLVSIILIVDDTIYGTFINNGSQYILFYAADDMHCNANNIYSV